MEPSDTYNVRLRSRHHPNQLKYSSLKLRFLVIPSVSMEEVQDCGLAPAFRENEEIRLSIQMCSALALVPLEMVGCVFKKASLSTRSYGCITTTSSSSGFRTSIGIPREMWNRTDNVSEANKRHSFLEPKYKQFDV